MNAPVWTYAALSIFLFASITFIPAFLLKKNDLADVIWGPGFLVSGAGAWLWGQPGRVADARLILAFSMIGLWALRLFWHVGRRNLLHREEDTRYLNWRKEWGRNWVWRSYLQVFVLQGIFLLVINAPLLWILGSPSLPLDFFCFAGAFLWILGFLFETISDEQLRIFKTNPANKGRIMTSGLWSWSRHPNYFGEVVQWWGIFLLALPLPAGFLTVLSPIAITFLILKVSGVPMLEKLMENRAGFDVYRRRTSIFFPRPPRNLL